MRVYNQYTAPIDGIAPGTEGDVDEKNPGVKVWLDAKLLVPASAPRPEPKPSAPSEKKG